MAVVYMDDLTIPDYKLGQSDNDGYEYSTNNLTGNEGDSIIIPDNIQSITVTLKVSGGSGRIEWTNDSLASVLAGTNDWYPWDWGDVTANTSDVFHPCTAIRAYRTSGTVSCQVRGQ